MHSAAADAAAAAATATTSAQRLVNSPLHSVRDAKRNGFRRAHITQSKVYWLCAVQLESEIHSHTYTRDRVREMHTHIVSRLFTMWRLWTYVNSVNT